ncbi:FecCD family ABC transporter permease [Cupriavidus agavae]|uniref:Iron complex transport system permease protein n=1 Tax=Cupriavidus agavae TaxID=1001822 RepID=A0A4Q7RFC2_9BURK|nr:iron ABC transporter permease [Cupriavidus agavae]RZT30800.1 iron complex transport system permease protein [Cupriavidus agavae]
MPRRMPATLILAAALPLVLILAMGAGRYAIAPGTVLRILAAPLLGAGDWNPIQQSVVQGVRLPRVLLAAVVGAGLAGAGAALQALFRNPLAEPQLLGVSSGAAFGGVLALLWLGDGWPVVSGALVWGLLSLLAVYWLAGARKGEGGTVLLVLAGIVVNAVFASGVSLIKVMADPQNQLPAIVFWLMGSLAAADYARLWLTLPCIGLSLLLLYGLRFHLMALAVGEADARSLGVPVRRVRVLALLAVGMIAASSVAVCGVVGWVGLVVPHLVRMSCGGDHRHFLIRAVLAGAAYLVLVDTLARTLTQMEIPLGALTALFGAPLFAFLIRRLGAGSHG